MLNKKVPLVLASSSSSRLKLLENINIYPDIISHPNIEEIPIEKELPSQLAVRLAKEKAEKVSKSFSDAIIIAADTVSACGRRILPKAQSDEEIESCLRLLSGKRHKVYSAVSVIKVSNNNVVKQLSRLNISILKFKRLEKFEINEYIKSKEGVNRSGGCNIEGMASSFIIWMSGSVSGIIGLPLYETVSLIKVMGYKKDR